MTIKGSDTAQKIDYFSLLPNELVQLIMFHYHESDYFPPIPLLSKQFLPHHRAQLYKYVEIRKLSNLALFLSTLSSKPDLGALVKSIKLDLTGDDTASDDAVAALQKSTTMAFRTLVSLRTIKLSGSERIWKYLLASPTPISQHLLVVSLSSTAATIDSKALHLSNFNNLIFYPSLVILSISFSSDCTIVSDMNFDPSTRSLDSQNALGDFQNLDYLALAANFSGLASPTDLLESCSPKKLVLYDYGDSTSKITEMLETLKRPEKLVILEIGSIALPRTPNFFDTLRRLSRLHTLSLTANCIFDRQEFYSILSILPLVDLTFSSSGQLSGVGASSLVEGSSKIATLRHLKLDHSLAEEGTFVRSREETDWVLPTWNGLFTRDELEAVREAGKKVGIEVTGKAFEAMEIEDRFEEIIASL